MDYYDNTARANGQPSTWSVAMFITSLLIGVGIIILLIVVIIGLGNIQQRENDIISSITQTLSEADGVSINRCNINRTQIIELFRCTQSSLNENINDNNFTNLLNDISWHPDLLAKIMTGHFIYNKFCLTNTSVVHFLMNNFINTTFPVAPSSTGDSFTNGLPNLCDPGAISGGFDETTQAFINLINFLVANGTQANASTPLQFYPGSSIPAGIGTTFYDIVDASQRHSCFTCELYCFMNQPVYMYSYKR